MNGKQATLPRYSTDQIIKPIFALRQFLPLALFLCLLISCSGCESDLSTGALVLPEGEEDVTNIDAGTPGDFAPFAEATLTLINEVRSTGCKCGNQNMPAWNYPNVDAVVAGWLASPGHCRNIMNTNFRYMGMGETDLYWTQVFAR